MTANTTAQASTSPSLSHEESRRAIDAHFAGRAAPPVEAAMRAHTLDCASCRSHYDRHLLLARLDPTAPTAESRLARGLGLRDGAGRPPRRGAVWLAAFAVPAAAAILLLSTGRVPEHPGAANDPGAFVARSAGPGVRAPALWIYRVDAGGHTRMVTDRIQATDELAFAYANPAGKPYLLVFGVDEHRHVYWFHPAWQPGQTPPVAVVAARGPGPHELSEAIRHGLDGRQLLIRALLADRPLGVSDVETEIRNAPSWDAPPGLLPAEPSAMAGRLLQVLP